MACITEARATGKANPEILTKLNKQKEETFNEKKLEVIDQDIESTVANDGTLPEGWTPEQFKMLTGNPKIMTTIQRTKMQEAMKLMLTAGRHELEQKIKQDPELQATIMRALR